MFCGCLDPHGGEREREKDTQQKNEKCKAKEQIFDMHVNISHVIFSMCVSL